MMIHIFLRTHENEDSFALVIITKPNSTHPFTICLLNKIDGGDKVKNMTRKMGVSIILICWSKWGGGYLTPSNNPHSGGGCNICSGKWKKKNPSQEPSHTFSNTNHFASVMRFCNSKQGRLFWAVFSSFSLIFMGLQFNLEFGQKNQEWQKSSFKLRKFPQQRHFRDNML